MMRNMQNQINSLKGEVKNEIQNMMKTQQAVLLNQQNVFQTNLQNMLSGFFQNQASASGTNPKGEMKAITTRSGVAYEGPSIPTNPSPKKVVERETEETTIKSKQISKEVPLKSHLRFADALLLMPRFAPTIKSLLMNKEKLIKLAKISLNENCLAMLLKKLHEKLRDPGKFLIPYNFAGIDVCYALADLGASINLMPLSIWKKLSLPDLTPTRMTLELADRSITYPKGLAEDVFVKIGNFHFPTDFVVVDFEADPRVPLIPGRSFLRTSRALIDVYKGELILRDANEQIIFHVNGTSKHPQKHVNESTKMVNDTCEILNGQPRNSSKKELPSALEYAYLEGNDKLPVIIAKGLKHVEKEALLKEKCLFMCREGIVLGHNIFKSGIEVDRAKVDVIAKLPHPTTVKGVRSFLGMAGFYRRFIQDFSKIARPMTHLLEKETPFVFSKDCIDAFETLKKKLTEAPILVVPDWNLPFELMCDASDFAIGALLLITLKQAVKWRCPIARILERTVGENRGSWSDKLDDALWAFCTAFKTPIGCTPYKLVYEKSCHLPIELEHKAYWALKHGNFDLKTAGDHRKLQLNELNELHDQAYENSLIYKERTKKLHDSKIKSRIFNVGDRVLLFNLRLNISPGKLKIRWS
ncbi:reverse transcriptase domain-containing protein [Tanacetum coccineum]